MEKNIISRVVRSRRKTISLQVGPDAKLVIRAPFRVSEECILRLINKKMPWIMEKQRLAREALLSRPQHSFREGEEFLYLGKPRPLHIVPEGSSPLAYNEGKFLLAEPHAPFAKRLFEKWYRAQALAIIKKRAESYAVKSGPTYSRITVTGARRRWGSCSSKKNLNFSWRLAMAPLEVIDYVIVHELVHLTVPNHSKLFWQEVSTRYPDYRRARQWLNKNHHIMDW